MTTPNDFDEDVKLIERSLRNIRIEKDRLALKEDELVKKLIRRSKVESDKINGGFTSVATNQKSFERKKTDAFQQKLQVGDNIVFLTSGRSGAGVWTIYKLTETRVLCKKGNERTFRAYKNVKKIT